MLRFYVEFKVNSEISTLWGGDDIGTSTKTFELSGRDMEEALLIKPKEAYAFRFFNQNEIICEDGEVIHGKKKDWSPLYYLGEGPYSSEELLACEQAEKYKEEIDLLRDIHDHQELRKCQEAKQGRQFPNAFVITDDGRLHLLYDDEAVVASSRIDF